MKPDTPLPWSRAQGHFQRCTSADIDYFIHAANAYPRLVSELQRICAELGSHLDAGKPLTNNVLRDLGEQR